MSAASQRSLHSFWALPTRPASAHVYMLMDTTMAVESQAQCEDCDARLPSEEAFDAMDVDGQTGYQCRGCSRQICDACAVAADDGRKCLQCYAGHGLGKRWVGGIGWM
jgi:flavoprotein